jgi:signal transduction histidine kinase
MTFDRGTPQRGLVYSFEAVDLTYRSHRLYRRAIALTIAMPAPALLLGLDPAYRTWRLAAWAGCYVVFVGLALAGRRARRGLPVLIALQVATALAATAVLPTSAEGAFLVTAAAQLAPHVSLRMAVLIVTTQTLAFGWLLSLSRPIEIAVDVPLAWFAFQTFAILLTHVARSEAEGRAALLERNVELHATRHLLAERTRAAERLRMARDLHDGLGHHLTALSLNLEAASYLSQDAALEHVQRAHATARALLADVRQTVSRARDDATDPLDAIRALVGPIDVPQVHLSAPETLPVSDPTRAEALLRLVQEIVTNTLRHARARNLWISVAPAGGVIEVEGRDDGVGAASWRDGNGLRGMRERLLPLGGSLDVASTPGAGFVVHARIPEPGATA